MTRPVPRVRRGKPRPVASPGGSGRAWMIPLLGRSALQLIEDQAAMLLEYAKAPFERIKWRLARVKRVLNDYTPGERSGPSIRRCAGWLGQDASFPEHEDAGNEPVELGEALGHVTFNLSFQIEVATRPAVRRATCFTRTSQRAESDFRLRRLLR